MRALLVSNDFPPQVGGIQQYALQLARRLPAAAVLAPAHPDAAAFDRAQPFPMVRGTSTYLWPTRGTRALLDAAIAAHRPDLLIYLAPFPLPALGGRGLPFAVCTHGAELIIPGRIPLLRRGWRRWLRAADGLFTVSRYTGCALRHLVGPDGPPIRLLPNGVDLDAFRPDLDPSPIRARYALGDDPVVVCVGRLVPRKGQDMLVRALPAIRARVPGTRLLLVGDGRLRQPLDRAVGRAVAADRLSSDAVTFTGAVTVDELPAHLAAADVFAHPNRSRWLGLEQEGFGIVFLEAQACGRPVVAGNSGGAPEAVLPGETGLVVDGRDVTAVAGAVVSLLADPPRARTMGGRGRAFVAERYAWPRIIAQLPNDLAALVSQAPLPNAL